MPGETLEQLLTRLERRAIPTGAAIGLIAAIALLATAWADAAERLAAPVPEQLTAPRVAGWSPGDHGLAWHIETVKRAQ